MKSAILVIFSIFSLKLASILAHEPSLQPNHPLFSKYLLPKEKSAGPENGTGPPPYSFRSIFDPAPFGAIDEMTMQVMMNVSPEIAWIPYPKAAAMVPKAAPEDPPVPVKPPPRPNRGFWPKRIWESQTEGTENRTPDCGFGKHRVTNYSTLALLLAPDYERGRLLPMIDLRAHHLNNGDYAANIGIVGRFVPKSFCALIGLNAYYDFQQGSNGYYHQAGVGLEVLGSRVDFRANSYFPVASQQHMNKCVFDDYIGDYFAINRRWEFGSYGGNAELGYLIVNARNFFLYLAAGPYYFSGNFKQSIAGGEVRLRPQFRDYVALDLRVNYDTVFKTSFDGMVIVSVPLYEFYSYLKGKKGPCGITSRQIYQQVERFQVLQLRTKSCWETNF